jgi:drug/metabolite transporter (DMT)-like permease
MTATHDQRLGAALCLASAVAFGVLAVFGKLAFDAGVGVVTLLFVRFALAAPILWAAAFRRAEAGPLARTPARTVLAALALGAVGYAMQAGLYFAALKRMDASILSLVLYTYPAFVTVAAIGLGRETPNRRRIGALLVSSAGVALVLAGAGAGGVDLLGAAKGVGAALSYTAYILVSDRVGGRLDPLPLSALVTTGAAVTFGIAGAATGSLDTGFANEGWGWLAAIAIVSTVTPIVLFFAGLRRVGPSMAAILSTLEPPTTVAFAFLVFGESLTGVQIAGGALVLAAVVALQLKPRAAVRIPRQDDPERQVEQDLRARQEHRQHEQHAHGRRGHVEPARQAGADAGHDAAALRADERLRRHQAVFALSLGALRGGSWISSSAGWPAASSRLRSSSAFSSAPNRTARLVIHIQTRKLTTPPSVPYVFW